MTEVTAGEAGFVSTRTSAQAGSGKGYVVPPLTQLRWPTACAASSRVRLAKAAHDGPWSAPFRLVLSQMSASIWDGLRVAAICR